METPFPANSSALALADNCIVDCDISAENLAVAECVLRIIDNGIEKLQIAILIPEFLENQDVLMQCMGKSHLRKCIKYYEDYIEQAEKMHDKKQHVNIPLIELIDLFCENDNIKQILPEYLLKIPKEYNELLDALRKLKTIADDRLKTTAVVEMQREKAIHRIYQDNEKTVKNLSKLKKQLHDQEINLRWKLAAKRALIKKYEEDLATKKWENNLKIKQEILRSSHKIRDFHANSLLKQEQLAEEVEKAQTTYEKGLKANLKTEKDIRDEKNKLLLQLQGLIKKYDQNIGDKIQENSDLQIAYDEQRQKLDEFLIEFRRQEDEYNELAQMKLNEETADFQRKLLLFMTTRAAKTVQRYWRKYIKTKKKSSKGKGKGKKGKKK
ncbi:golgin subfamily A member 6-like protein 26 [Episyrphus balteatus]|uniref:golgin subfamily A member 6-like protein 26 n=1 Tax=Episyrphus balteatus TaxID=286459 RepID=UPI002486073B|nr:golgin subfamily A member 6-like protein 26 [Episyrphus balteatus]